MFNHNVNLISLFSLFSFYFFNFVHCNVPIIASSTSYFNQTIHFRNESISNPSSSSFKKAPTKKSFKNALIELSTSLSILNSNLNQFELLPKPLPRVQQPQHTRFVFFFFFII